MVTFKLVSLLSAFCLLLISGTMAQSLDSTRNVSDFLDDGGISGGKNIIKVNLAASASGDLAFSYERKLSDLFSIEVSAGYLLPFLLEQFPYFVEYDKDFYQTRLGGYSYSLQPKIYYFSQAMDSGYEAIKFTKRSYQQDGNDIEYHTIILNSGYQLNLRKRLMLDWALGYGLRFDTVNGNKAEYGSFGDIPKVLPITFKVGYLF